ncbi:MAG: trigger factor [Holosporaceae bacterium]|jgi:trigger factor|nr:trigger factor [Holosporaceae bacterium]
MKVLSRTSDGLGRCYNILISPGELDAAMTTKLHETAKKVRLDGFRPGKVPLEIVKRMHGDSLVAESKKQAITNISKKILDDEKLVISFSYITDIVKDDENGLEFTLKFEIVPTFELKDVSGIEIKKYVAEIADKEIDEILETVRKDHKKWVENKDVKKIKEGQKVIVDLVLRTASKKLKNNKISDLEIVIGDKTLLEDFWKHLIGAKIAETREFSVTYPTDIADKALAGKTVEYEATVKKILDSTGYNMDDEFAKSIGHENLEKAREWAKSRAISKYDYMTKDIMRRDLLDKIAEMYDFDVPQNMLRIEYNGITRQIKEEAQKLGKEFSPAIQEECNKIAQKRIRLGFVITSMAKKEKITVSRNEIFQSIKNIATMHPGREKAIWETYTRDDSIQAIIGPILEVKIVNFLLDKIKVTEEKCSVSKLVSIDEEPFEFFKDDKSIPQSKKSSAKSKTTKRKSSPPKGTV